MDITQRRQLVQQYREGHAAVVAALEGATDAELDRRPARGKWTAREIVHHLADSEMTSAIRLRRRGKRPGKVLWTDAREIVSVEWGPLGPAVRWDVSQANAARFIPRDPATLIITGFVARDAQGLQTTLGRNGSDFSGSIFGDMNGATDTSARLSMARCTVSSYMWAQATVSSFSRRQAALLAKPTLRPTGRWPSAARARTIAASTA